MTDTNVAHVNRTYRSTVFIMLFEEKENLLELYNAMSGKHYTDPELLEINTLEFIIFYNGEEERPERETLRLSDLYIFRGEDGRNGESDYRLELKAELLNICGDNNKALKDACHTLREYAVFTDKMRTYAKTMDIEVAAERTIEECIREDVLREFLEKHKAEVIKVSIFEYDQEKHLRQEREQAWEEGREVGITEGIAKGKAAGIAEGRKSWNSRRRTE